MFISFSDLFCSFLVATFSFFINFKLYIKASFKYPLRFSFFFSVLNFNIYWKRWKAIIPNQILWQRFTPRKTIYFFLNILKRWFSQNVPPEYDTCIIRKDFFFPKIWSYSLDGKWKIIFLKKHMEIWYFLQIFQKDGFSKKYWVGIQCSLYYQQRLCFLSWKHDRSP